MVVVTIISLMAMILCIYLIVFFFRQVRDSYVSLCFRVTELELWYAFLRFILSVNVKGLMESTGCMVMSINMYGQHLYYVHCRSGLTRGWGSSGVGESGMTNRVSAFLLHIWVIPCSAATGKGWAEGSVPNSLCRIESLQPTYMDLFVELWWHCMRIR